MSHHPYPYIPLSKRWTFPLTTQYIEAYPGAAKFPGSYYPICEIEDLVNEGRWTHDNRGFRLTGTDQYTLHSTGPRRLGKPAIEKIDAWDMRQDQLRRAEVERRRFEEEMQQRDAMRRASEERSRDFVDPSSRRGVSFAPTRLVRTMDFDTGVWRDEREEKMGDNEGRSDEYRWRDKERASKRKDGSYRSEYKVTEQPGYRGPLW